MKISEQIKEYEKKKDEEFGGKLSQLEEKLKSEQLFEAKVIGEQNLCADNLKEEEKKMSQLIKNLEGDRRITASKQKQFDCLNENLERLKTDNELKEQELMKAEKEFEDISAGKSRAQEGEAAATLADQLMTVQKEIATADTDIKKAEMKLKHSRSELSKKESEVKKVKNTYDKDMKEIDAMNSEVQRLKAAVENTGFDEQKHSELGTNLGQMKRQINSLSGQMRERRTLVPLDRIRGNDADIRALRRAQDIVGKENVDYAINYIDYDPTLSQTMKYVFGDTLICPNMEIAKRVVYAPGVQKRAVTFDGEVFAPSGVLSGGASAQGVQLLVKVAEIANKRQQLEELKDEFNRMEAQFRQMNNEMKNYSELKTNYELKAREAELVRQRLQSGNQHIMMQEIQELKQTIQNEEQILSDSSQIKNNASKRVQELQTKLRDSKSIREREQKEAEQNLKNARTQAEKSRKVLAVDQQKADTLQL